MASRGVLFSIFVLFLMALSAVEAVVMGIDFGSSSYKAVLVQSKFRIVLNEQSGRKTSSSISFRQGQRAFSSGADNAARFQPDISFNYLRDLLGKESLDHPAVQALKNYIFYGNRLVERTAKASDGSPIDYKYLALTLEDGTEIGVYELIAMILEQTRLMVEKDAGTKVPDAVITVPVYFTQRERQALIEAAELAGINVLSLINEPTAFALQYALDFASFTEPKNVLFVDVGESALQLGVFKYELVAGKDKKNVTQITNLASAWDTALGGREFDRSLVAHFAKQLKAKGADIYSNKRAHYRLLTQMHKSKEVLSANKEMEFSLDGLINDIDFRGKITRQEFEEMNAPLFAGIQSKIETVLKTANLTKEEVAYIELIGGSSRVPRLQEELKKFFNRETLDFHLNGDESGVFGAAFFAASLSPQHRVRELRLKDATPWRVGLNVTELDGVVLEEGEESVERNTTLFKDGNRYQSKKTISFNAPRNFGVDLFYNVSDEDPVALPRGTTNRLDHLVFSGVPAPATYNTTEPPKAHLSFRLSSSGTIELVDHKVELQVTELVRKVKPKLVQEKVANATEKPPVTNETDGSASTEEEEEAPVKPEGEEGEVKPEETVKSKESSGDSDDDSKAKDAKEEDAPKVEEPPEYFMEEKVVTKSIPLKVAKSLWAYLPFVLRKNTVKLMSDFTEKDRIRVQTEVAKNDLEALIISSKENIEEENFMKYSTEAEREKIGELANEARDWLEGDGETATLSEYVEKKGKLGGAVSPVQFRIGEARHRSEAADFCLQVLNATRSYLSILPLTHNVTDDEVNAVVTLANSTEEWLARKLVDQDKLELFKVPIFYSNCEKLFPEDPIVTSEQIKARCEPIQKQAATLLRRPKKKPPPVPVNITFNNESQTANDTQTTADEENTAQGEEPKTDSGDKDKEPKKDL